MLARTTIYIVCSGYVDLFIVGFVRSSPDAHYATVIKVRETRCIRLSLCSPDEPSVQTDGTSIGRWRDYVNTYVMTHPTEWMPEAKKNASPVFLRRCVGQAVCRHACLIEIPYF